MALLVPNFSANKINGFNAASFAMRGVGNTDIIVYNEAPVAVLIDDFVMPSTQTQLLDPFDVQEVEVLRGPQGTLFGKNTTGGAVVVQDQGAGARRNDHSKRKAAAAATTNTTSRAHSTFRSSPISSRCAWSRARSVKTAGCATAQRTPIGGTTYTGDGQRVGGTDVFTGRAKLLVGADRQFAGACSPTKCSPTARRRPARSMSRRRDAASRRTALPYFAFA